jgi:CubicO group peptidase (beta-lactamase class C family)
MVAPITEPELTDELEGALGRHGALGAVAAVVQDGRLGLVVAAGRRRLDDHRGVGADTVFPVASITKTFTAGALAVLVDRGVVGLEDPVRRHLPDLRFADALRTEETTLLDLAAHRTGLPRHPLADYVGDYSSPELLDLLAHVEPAFGLRSRYSYTNLTYLALGTALAAAARTSYADLIAETLLEPLGLRTATASFPQAMASADLAAPHDLVAGRHVAVPRLDRTRHAPASVVHAGGTDLGRWLETFAGPGAEQLFGRSHGHFREAHSVAPGDTGGLDHAAFAMSPVWLTSLAWGMWVYHGRVVLSHGGDVDGFKSDCVVVPEAGFACGVLANTGESPLGSALCGWALDRALTGETVAWADRVTPMRGRGAPGSEPDGLARRVAPVGEHAGTYRHPGFGDLTLDVDGGDLLARFARAPRWPLRLVPTANGGWQVLDATDPGATDWPLADYAPRFDDPGGERTVQLGTLGTWRRER